MPRDFQVHTPRDENWTGTSRPTTEDEQCAYADEFVAACRKKGLDVVAITDHHTDHHDVTDREKIAVSRILDSERWLSFLLYDLADVPFFEYCVASNDYIAFDKASPGQQATALLAVLLNRPGPPLVIDQTTSTTKLSMTS